MTNSSLSTLFLKTMLDSSLSILSLKMANSLQFFLLKRPLSQATTYSSLMNLFLNMTLYEVDDGFFLTKLLSNSSLFILFSENYGGFILVKSFSQEESFLLDFHDLSLSSQGFKDFSPLYRFLGNFCSFVQYEKK